MNENRIIRRDGPGGRSVQLSCRKEGQSGAHAPIPVEADAPTPFKKAGWRDRGEGGESARARACAGTCLLKMFVVVVRGELGAILAQIVTPVVTLQWQKQIRRHS
jgi:hypothetical protein